MTTPSKRDLLSSAAANSALAASGVVLDGKLAAPADMSQGGGGRYVLPVSSVLAACP